MSARTDFSALRTTALAHQMGAKLSQPADDMEALQVALLRRPGARFTADETLLSEFNASTYVLGFILAAVVIAVCWGTV